MKGINMQLLSSIPLKYKVFVLNNNMKCDSYLLVINTKYLPLVLFQEKCKNSNNSIFHIITVITANNSNCIITFTNIGFLDNKIGHELRLQSDPARHGFLLLSVFYYSENTVNYFVHKCVPVYTHANKLSVSDIS